MTTAVLAMVGLFACFVLYHMWCQAQWTAERARLVNAAIAETPADFAALEHQRTRPSPKVRDDDDDDRHLEPIGYSGV